MTPQSNRYRLANTFMIVKTSDDVNTDVIDDVIFEKYPNIDKS